MDKRIEVIGIDHGWSNMKTAAQVFTTGVKEITTEPAFFDNVVEFGGVYYKVGGKRLEVRDCKVENESFYILTLAALAKELCRRGKREADVLLSVGLPLTRFGAEKQEFISYLSRNKEVTFRFEKKRYKARIARVSVFPQCYEVPVDVGTPEELAQMVEEVNLTQVPLKERLSNQVYFYDKEQNTLSFTTDTPTKRLDGMAPENHKKQEKKQK